ncbi:hypothetical protein [Methylobacterium nigriterrae]|uniref:hypothetical protein n=1 Tax=Methylobacterium nigriterrae TaxID=3127512 RepID=UPI003013E3D0
MPNYTQDEKSEALLQLRKQFPDLSDADLRAAIEGSKFSVPPQKGGRHGKRMIGQIESTLAETDDSPDLTECLTVAKDAFDIAMETAAAIQNATARLVAETVARIAYAVGKAYCRAEHG